MRKTSNLRMDLEISACHSFHKLIPTPTNKFLGMCEGFENRAGCVGVQLAGFATPPRREVIVILILFLAAPPKPTFGRQRLAKQDNTSNPSIAQYLSNIIVGHAMSGPTRLCCHRLGKTRP